jgi:predicted DsbA family dithiol-disulfide isomerase
MQRPTLSRGSVEGRFALLGNTYGKGSKQSFPARLPHAQHVQHTHQLLHWAGLKGRKLDLKLALFTEHFTNQCNVSDDAVLVDFAAEIGLDRAEAVAVLEDQHFANDVRSAGRFSQQQDNIGAPAIVFDQKHLVTGAQGVENYSSIPSHLVETKG